MKKRFDMLKQSSIDGRRRIEVLFVLNSCKRCGPTQVICNIIKNLDFSKYKPIILTFREEPSNSSLKEIIGYVHGRVVCKISKSDILLGRLGKLKETLDKIGADAIHTTGVFPDYAISRISAHNQVVTMHNYAPANYISSFGITRGCVLVKMQYYAARHAAKTVACSESLTRLYYPKLNLEYVRNGIDVEKYCVVRNKKSLRKKLGIDYDAFVFIYVGHLSLSKNVECIIKNFLDLYNNNKKIVLLLLGDGVEATSLKKKYLLFDNIKFVGEVINVDEYLKASDVYVSASKTEGMPNSVLEAMACGLPVLLSNIPQHNEILECGNRCGYLFSINDGRELKQKMQQLVCCSDLPTLSKNARLVVEEQFDSKKMSLKYQEIYDSVYKRKILNENKV